MSFDLVALGLNAVDVLIRLPAQIRKDDKQRVHELMIQGGAPAGSGASGVARLGYTVAFAARVGDNAISALCLEEFRKNGVKLDLMMRDERSRPALALVEIDPVTAARTVFIQMDDYGFLRPEDIPVEAIRKSRALLVDSYDLDATEAALRAASGTPCQTVLDFEGGDRERVRSLLALGDHAILPLGAGRHLTDRETASEVLGALVDLTDGQVVVTDGIHGSWAWDRAAQTVHHQPAFRVASRDSTGCGDAFHAGYIVGLLEGWTLAERMEFGALLASRVSTLVGGRTALPKLPELLSLLRRKFLLPCEIISTNFMTAPSLFPTKGVASDVIADLVGSPQTLPSTRIGLIGVGLKMHFVWKNAVANYQQAQRSIGRAWQGSPLTLIAPPEPFESAEDVIMAADRLLSEGIKGLIIFHASYTAGEIGSQLGRWLTDHRMPLLSWAFPEPVGGRLTANSLCCQNFILNAFNRLEVRYQWIFSPVDDAKAAEQLKRFGCAVRARAVMINGKLLHVGSGRVPGFYDAEADELAVFKRFGLRFDRVDFVQIFERAKRFSEAQLRSVMQAIVESPQCGFNNVAEPQFFQTLRLALGVLAISREQNYLGSAIRCWPDLWDHWGCAADGALSLINDQGSPCADETDMNGLISMMAMHLVTGGAALPTLMDISLLDVAKNRLGFWHCGGSATRLVRAGTKFETRRHSIMENADETTAVGMLVESLLALGPVTVTRYLSPDSARAFLFEGQVKESPMAFRGAYAEVEPTGKASAEQLMGTILDRGFDHHWVMGRGHFASDLQTLNHLLDVEEQPVTNVGESRGFSQPTSP